MMHFGHGDVAIMAIDLDAADHVTLAAQADVFQTNADLDVALSGPDRAALVGFLNTIDIPPGWVSVGNTWREVLRTLAGMFGFATRVHGIRGQDFFDTGITRNLNSRLDSYSVEIQDALTQAAADLGMDISGLDANARLRDLMEAVGADWMNRPFILAGFSI